MPPFLFRCSDIGKTVQGFIAVEVPDDADSYETVTCLACRKVHLVNPATSKVLGAADEE